MGRRYVKNEEGAVLSKFFKPHQEEHKDIQRER